MEYTKSTVRERLVNCNTHFDLDQIEAVMGVIEQSRFTKMYEALKEISEGKGAYSLDPLKHASNTIDNMKKLALEALAEAEGKEEK